MAVAPGTVGEPAMVVHLNGVSMPQASINGDFILVLFILNTVTYQQF